MIRLADYVIQKLYENNVKHIFMVTGRGALFLTDAVAAHKEIEGICVHHEQSASFAATSYAQFNENLGACLVSTGCASTNTLTGVLNAWQDGVPCIFISGQNKLDETSNYTGINVRTYGQQEANIIPIVEPITKYATMIKNPDDIVYELEKALFLAQTGRKGPVWLDIPLDVQNMRVDINKVRSFVPEQEAKISCKPEEIEIVEKYINESQRPILLIGSGIRSAGAIEEFEKFVSKTNIPVVYAPSGADIYGLDNDLTIGSVGIMGCTRAGNFSIQNSDLILVLGNRLNSMVVGEKCQFGREAKTIVIDIDETEHSKCSADIDRLIISDLNEFLKLINEKQLKNTDIKWTDKCMHWKNIFPRTEERHFSKEKIDLYDLAEKLSNVLPEKSSVITDSGLIELILPSNMVFKKGQRSIHPASQGCMGVALPALIGSYYSSNEPVIAVVGDGSILMNIQELITISYKKIPAKIFVINNNAYAVIRKRMKEMFRNRTIGVDASDGVGAPDFKNIAECFGINYSRIDNGKNLESKLKKVIETNGPVLCEVFGLEDQDYIASGHARDSNNKYVARPLEDQKPFIDRKTFLSEMIIDPIGQ